MSSPPVSIQADAPALSALDLMVDHGIRHLPVVDAGQHVVGMLSIDDLRAAFPVEVSLQRPPEAAVREQLREALVGDLMRHVPRTVRSETPVREAAGLMAEGRLGCLPVVDAGARLVGVLSQTDVLRAVASAFGDGRLGRKPAAQARSEALLAGLRRERDRLGARLDAFNRHEQEITRKRHEEPLDLAEHGAEAEEARLTEELADSAARRLEALEHAMRRAEQGILGQCERCGGSIPHKRLRALPGTALCIGCAREAEGDRRR